MTLYFAYGSNMSRALMRPRCRSAREVGTAVLAGWRFIVMRDGYASIVRDAGGVVHGLMWRLGPRDLAALNAYERLEQGLYRAVRLPVRMGNHNRNATACVAALVYIGRSREPGRPRPGYLDLVLAAARDAGLPAAYVAALARWHPSGWRGARAPEIGEVT